jgi:hypothetical protein
MTYGESPTHIRVHNGSGYAPEEELVPNELESGKLQNKK